MSAAQDISPFLHIDQFGYPTTGRKVAVISNPQIGYNSQESYVPSATMEVVALSGEVAFAGPVAEWNGGGTHGQSGDAGWWFDFSGLTAPGMYYLSGPGTGARTGHFVIGDDVYREVLRAAGRMFYYNRCGTPKLEAFAGAWSDENSFDHPLQDTNCRFIEDPDNVALEKDLSGGWFDAGDYNKYVTFTATTLHYLLSAYEENPQAFSDQWNIPESGNGLSDLIDEVKWELDWLAKMVNEDGSVHNKVGSQNHSENAASPPSANSDPRFYGPTCSSASITIASVFAHAALVFEGLPGLQPYADTLLATSQLCFDYSQPFVDDQSYETDCDDLSIVAGDSDQGADWQLAYFLTAAIYLYEQTQDPLYNDYITAHAAQLEQLANGFWGPYFVPVNDALVRYAGSPQADGSTATNILDSFSEDISNNYNGYYGFSSADLYRAYMPDWSYHWGSSHSKAAYGHLNYLVVQSGLTTDTLPFRQYVDEAIHYFHGVNPLGLVYLSNMYSLGAERSANEIYHIWFADGTSYDHALKSSIGPPPGYVTGGPNVYFSVESLVPPSGQPEQKSYLDFNTGWPSNSWEITEPAIYYQAAYLRLLAHRVEDSAGPAGAVEAFAEAPVIYPNPARHTLYFRSASPVNRVEVYWLTGAQVIDELSWAHQIDVSDLRPGIYLLRLNRGPFQKLIKQ